MTNTTITNFRKNLFEYIDNAIKYNDTVTIATKGGNAVVISEDEYNGLLETIKLSAIPGMVDSILTAAKEPIEDGEEYDPEAEW